MRWFILILLVAVLTSGCSSSGPRGDALTEGGSIAPESNDSTWIVKGRFLDEDTEEPLILANAILRFRIKGIDTVFETGAATDVNGNFSIVIASKKQPIEMTLRPSYIGYLSQARNLPDFGNSTVLDLAELYVSADPDGLEKYKEVIDYFVRPMIDKTQTNFKVSVWQEQIENLPVR